MKQFNQVFTKDRLPKIKDNYIIKEKRLDYVTQFTFDPLSYCDIDIFKTKVEWFLEEIQPTGKTAEEILNALWSDFNVKHGKTLLLDPVFLFEVIYPAIHEFSHQQPKPTDEEIEDAGLEYSGDYSTKTDRALFSMSELNEAFQAGAKAVRDGNINTKK